MTLQWRFLGLPTALCLASVPVGAQTATADVTATVEVLPSSVTLTPVAGFDFGQAYANEGVVTSSARSTAAQWDGSATRGPNLLELGFALPTELAHTSDPKQPGVPISFGINSGRVVIPPTAASGRVTLTFDPNVPFVINQNGAVPITFEVYLGPAGGASTTDVAVDLTGAAPGVYSATITLTVTIL